MEKSSRANDPGTKCTSVVRTVFRLKNQVTNCIFSVHARSTVLPDQTALFLSAVRIIHVFESGMRRREGPTITAQSAFTSETEVEALQDCDKNSITFHSCNETYKSITLKHAAQLLFKAPALAKGTYCL